MRRSIKCQIAMDCTVIALQGQKYAYHHARQLFYIQRSESCERATVKAKSSGIFHCLSGYIATKLASWGRTDKSLL